MDIYKRPLFLSQPVLSRQAVIPNRGERKTLSEYSGAFRGLIGTMYRIERKTTITLSARPQRICIMTFDVIDIGKSFEMYVSRSADNFELPIIRIVPRRCFFESIDCTSFDHSHSGQKLSTGFQRNTSNFDGEKEKNNTSGRRGDANAMCVFFFISRPDKQIIGASQETVKSQLSPG